MTTAQFDCQYCTTSLLGKKYVLKDDNPYCISCYDHVFCNYCEECKEAIESDSKVGLISFHKIIAYKQLTHALECFFSFTRLLLYCSAAGYKNLQSYH